MTNNPTPPQTKGLDDNAQPGFGWTSYAERLNGRFAMIGFVALILIEIIYNQGFISWLGF